MGLQPDIEFTTENQVTSYPRPTWSLIWQFERYMCEFGGQQIYFSLQLVHLSQLTATEKPRTEEGKLI